MQGSGTVSATVELVPVREMAEELGVDTKTVYRLIHRDVVRAYRLGAHATVVDARDVARLKREGWPGMRPSTHKARVEELVGTGS
jgi:excisionase family DNA binding protein